MSTIAHGSTLAALARRHCDVASAGLSTSTRGSVLKPPLPLGVSPFDLSRNNGAYRVWTHRASTRRIGGQPIGLRTIYAFLFLQGLARAPTTARPARASARTARVRVHATCLHISGGPSGPTSATPSCSPASARGDASASDGYSFTVRTKWNTVRVFRGRGSGSRSQRARHVA